MCNFFVQNSVQHLCKFSKYYVENNEQKTEPTGHHHRISLEQFSAIFTRGRKSRNDHRRWTLVEKTGRKTYNINIWILFLERDLIKRNLTVSCHAWQRVCKVIARVFTGTGQLLIYSENAALLRREGPLLYRDRGRRVPRNPLILLIFARLSLDLHF